ncbi:MULTISPECIES: hypothetical protein [Microbacterium]|uniref:hypothetical protein n=1 Tax=Microbacterium TaxID=33882 RepID=UPI000D65D3E8|nr:MULTISPECIES: hypothetical protein [Microbacterium]
MNLAIRRRVFPVAIFIGLVCAGCAAQTPATEQNPPASGSDDATRNPLPEGVREGASPTRTTSKTMPPDWCEPREFPEASLDGAAAPAPGEHLTLPADPCLTAKSLLGSYSWLEDQGIDADQIQGFQAVAGIEPWTAPLADGTGHCILLRADDHNGWGKIACDTPGGSASVERTVDGASLRFSLERDAVVVYTLSP